MTTITISLYKVLKQTLAILLFSLSLAQLVVSLTTLSGNMASQTLITHVHISHLS